MIAVQCLLFRYIDVENAVMAELVAWLPPELAIRHTIVERKTHDSTERWTVAAVYEEFDFGSGDGNPTRHSSFPIRYRPCSCIAPGAFRLYKNAEWLREKRRRFRSAS